MDNITEQVKCLGIIPVVKIEDCGQAVPICEALVKGGLSAVEITFRTAAAKESIKAVKTNMPNVLLGAGTVLTQEQANDAIEAGAQFIVSPGCNPKVIECCQKQNIPIIPGCVTPSEIEIALSYGIKTVKFFPAELSGGISMMKTLKAPYGDISFIPTGGINEKNIQDYLRQPYVIACGGSFMVKEEWIRNKTYEKITEATREAVSLSLGFEIAHIGLHSDDEKTAKTEANRLSVAFGFPVKEGNSSIFAGKGIEVVKRKLLDKPGHIAIKTLDIERAKNYLKGKGFSFDEKSTKMKNGVCISVYLNETFCGIPIHLLQNN